LSADASKRGVTAVQGGVTSLPEVVSLVLSVLESPRDHRGNLDPAESEEARLALARLAPLAARSVAAKRYSHSDYLSLVAAALRTALETVLASRGLTAAGVGRRPSGAPSREAVDAVMKGAAKVISIAVKAAFKQPKKKAAKKVAKKKAAKRKAKKRGSR
jgi:hypothetical protein